MPHHTPPTPRGAEWGGGVGHVGGGVEVGHWGSGVLEECRLHMHTYTHVGTRITVGRVFNNSELQLTIHHFDNFVGKMDQRIHTDREYPIRQHTCPKNRVVMNNLASWPVIGQVMCSRIWVCFKCFGLKVVMALLNKLSDGFWSSRQPCAQRNFIYSS